MDSIKSNPSVLDDSGERDRNGYESFDVVDYEEMNSDHSDLEAEASLLKVMFHGCKNSYRFGEAMNVRFYSFNDCHQMDEADRVGIAPLKRSPFYSQKVANAAEDASIDIISEDFIEESQITARKLTFIVEELPSEIKDERFFQFCYLNSSAQIIGLSIPFQFLKSKQSSPAPEVAEEQQQQQQSSVMEIEVSSPGQSDEVHCERQEDDDFIVVRTTDNFLKERVQHLTRNNNLIQNLVRNLQTELAMKIQENSNLNEEMQKVENKCIEAKKELDRLIMVTGIEKENIRKTYSASVDTLKREIAKNEREISELRSTIDERTEVIQALTDDLEGVRKVVPESQEKDKRIDELKQSLEVSKNEYETYRTKREDEVKDLEETLRKSMDNLKNMNLKYETSQANSAAAERDLRMKLKNEQDRVQLLLAKLEEAKIEYSMAHNRTLYFKNKTFSLRHELAQVKKTQNTVAPVPEVKPIPASVIALQAPAPTLPSAPPMYTEITVMETEPFRDEIDSRLDDLEREEMEIQQQQHVNQPQGHFSSSESPKSQSIFGFYEKERKQQDEEEKKRQRSAQQAGRVEIHIDDDHERLPSAEPVIEPKFQTIPKCPLPGTSTSSARRGENYFVVLPCIFCNQAINCKQHNDGSGQMREMIEHLERVHQQKMCPICSTLFDMQLPVFKSYFTTHVNEHLKNATYPTLER